MGSGFKIILTTIGITLEENVISIKFCTKIRKTRKGEAPLK